MNFPEVFIFLLFKCEAMAFRTLHCCAIVTDDINTGGSLLLLKNWICLGFPSFVTFVGAREELKPGLCLSRSATLLALSIAWVIPALTVDKAWSLYSVIGEELRAAISPKYFQEGNGHALTRRVDHLQRKKKKIKEAFSTTEFEICRQGVSFSYLWGLLPETRMCGSVHVFRCHCYGFVSFVLREAANLGLLFQRWK